jgi:hypothetical protein
VMGPANAILPRRRAVQVAVFNAQQPGRAVHSEGQFSVSVKRGALGGSHGGRELCDGNSEREPAAPSRPGQGGRGFQRLGTSSLA